MIPVQNTNFESDPGPTVFETCQPVVSNMTQYLQRIMSIKQQEVEQVSLTLMTLCKYWATLTATSWHACLQGMLHQK